MQTIQITETFCPSETSSFTNSPYRGKLPLTANPIVRYNNAKLSAVGAVSYGNHTVVFLGTEQGQLLKVTQVLGKMCFLYNVRGYIVEILLLFKSFLCVNFN